MKKLRKQRDKELEKREMLEHTWNEIVEEQGEIDYEKMAEDLIEMTKKEGDKLNVALSEPE